jgi:hypothetical protein
LRRDRGRPKKWETEGKKQKDKYKKADREETDKTENVDKFIYRPLFQPYSLYIMAVCCR